MTFVYSHFGINGKVNLLLGAYSDKLVSDMVFPKVMARIDI